LNAGKEIMGKKSWERNHGKEIMGKKSWERNVGKGKKLWGENLSSLLRSHGDHGVVLGRKNSVAKKN
jgi:hypothetical protein